MTQTTIARLTHAIDRADVDRSIMLADSMLTVAQIVGDTLAAVTQEVRGKMQNQDSVSASMILAGQRADGSMRLFLIYSQGNFIEATAETPYLQIGEHKYGKPILDRVIEPSTSLADAEKAVLLSMDSTLRSNLSVGMPLDLVVIENHALRISRSRRIEPDDAEFQRMSNAWSEALRRAYQEI